MSVESYLRKADVLLGDAAATSNMKERSRLIDEALHWHRLAMEARDGARAEDRLRQDGGVGSP